MNNLPSNWKVKSLGDVTKVKSGFAFKSEDYLDEGIRLVRIGNLNGSSLEFGEETVYVDKEYLDSCKEFSLKENDVLIAMSGATTGKLALVKQKDLPCLLNQRVGLISISNHQNLNAKYLFYFLAKGDLRKQVLKLAGGSAQPNISPAQIMSFYIPLPPLPSQKQIAEILEKADKAKQKRKEANKLTDEFLQSVFIEMFGDPVKNPKGWEKKNLEEICNKITDGEHLNPIIVKTGKYMITAMDVREDGVDFSRNNFVSESDFNKFIRKCNPEKNDLLLVSRGATIGRCCVVNSDKKFCLMGSVILIKPKSIAPTYLLFLFREKNFLKYLLKLSPASAQQAIYIANIKTLNIPIPPLPLQKRFAEIVNKTEALKEKQKQSEQELENLFQSLMQKAFKGEML